MPQIVSKPPLITRPEPEDADNSIRVRRELDAILQSTPFRTTRQCQELLRYMVERTLEGQDQSLRERIIGVEVFGRKPDYDTSDDPVVRIRAADVRKRLAQYYQGLHGETIAVRIDIPPGSYRASFEWPQETHIDVPSLYAGMHAYPLNPAVPPAASPSTLAFDASGSTIAVDSLTSVRAGGSSRFRMWAVACALLFAALAITYLQRPAQKANARFDQFWEPFLAPSRPVLICMGSNVVYQLSHSFMVQYLQDHPLENHGMETFINLPPDTLIRAGDVHRALDSFVALGDVAAASKIVATLTRKNKPYEERFPPDISFAELEGTPTILVGGFNNALTMSLTKDLRFVLAQNSRVEDRQDKTRSWTVQFNGDARDAEDYAIVSRLLDSKSGGPVITLAGIGQYGTQAAAEFVSNPQMIANLVKTAPGEWRKKNVQVVLHVKVINFRPISIEVVGTHYW